MLLSPTLVVKISTQCSSSVCSVSYLYNPQFLCGDRLHDDFSVLRPFRTTWLLHLNTFPELLKETDVSWSFIKCYQQQMYNKYRIFCNFNVRDFGCLSSLQRLYKKIHANYAR
jgi:hypothetical protein